MRKFIAWGLLLAIALTSTGVYATSNNGGTNNKKDYIIVTKNKKNFKKVKDTYNDKLTDEYQEFTYLDENNVAVMKLTEAEAAKIEERSDVEFVEEDVVLTANTYLDSPESEQASQESTETTATTEERTIEAEMTTEVALTEEVSTEDRSGEDDLSELTPLVEHDDHEMFEDEFTPLTPEEENCWNINAIHALKSEIGNTDGLPKIKIGILDSGIDPIEDIEEIHSMNFVIAESDVPFFWQDGTGHATSIASIIGSTENGRGIVGVNPNAELYSIKVLDENNAAPVSRIIEGLMWAKDNDIQIINMSFSTPINSFVLHNTIKDIHEAGILMIASAGNESEIVEYPASYDEVISVGAINNKMEVADFSPKGVDLVAPGEEILASSMFGGYMAVTGTSIAAAHVTGLASLIWQKDPSKSREFVEQIMYQSANTIGEKSGYGIIDAKRALEIYNNIDENGDIIKSIKKNRNHLSAYSGETYVIGSWMGEDHNNQISTLADENNFTATDITWIKRFVQRADSSEYNSATVIALHGRKNYVANTKYLYTLALNLKKGQSDDQAIANANDSCVGVNPDLKKAVKDKLLKTEYYDASEITDSKIKSLKVLGFALHLAGDTYSHRTMVPMSEESDALFTKSDFSTTAHGTDTTTGAKHDINLLPEWCKDEYANSKKFCRKWSCFRTSKRNGHLEFIDIKYFMIERSNSKYEDNIKFYSSRYTKASNHACNNMLKTFMAGTGWQRKVFTPQFDSVDYKLRQNNLKKYYEAAGLDTSFNGTKFEWNSVGTLDFK